MFTFRDAVLQRSIRVPDAAEEASASEVQVVYTTFSSLTLLGLSGLEPPTSRLSGVRSNQLSYEPLIWQPPTLPRRLQRSTIGRLRLNHRVRDGNGCVP